MKSRRLAVGAAVIATSLLACQIILGIDDHDFKTPDAQVAIDAASMDAPDPCAHRLPQPRPNVPDDPTALPTITLAMRTFQLKARDADGGIVGFDLDGVCTCDPLTTNTQASCTPKTSTKNAGCDDEGGVDNAFSAILARNAAFLSTDDTDNEIDCGRRSFLLTLSGWNGKADDSSVEVTMSTSFGIREPHDAGEQSRPECDKGFIFDYPAKWDGTDRFSRFGPKTAFTGYVTDGTLVVDERGKEVALIFPIADTILSVGSFLLSARVVPNGSTIALVGGTLAGRIRTDDWLSASGALSIGTGGGKRDYLCRNDVLYGVVKTSLCSASETVLPPTRDFLGDPCNALSFGAAFTAFPSLPSNLEYDGRKKDASDEGGCGPEWRDTCP